MRETMAKPPRVRCVASDMDGTLLMSSRKIGARTKEKLIALQQAGIQVVLISGRPISGMQEAAVELELPRYGGALIGINGGHSYSFRTGREMSLLTLPLDQASRYMRAWDPFNVVLYAYGRKTLYVGKASAYHPTERNLMGDHHMERIRQVNHMQVEILDDLSRSLPERPLKICVQGARENILKGWEKVRPQVEEKIYAAFSANDYLEAMIRGVNKGTGLQEYADRFQIAPEEIIAFGDNDNDIPMLRYAGRGVAMGNATEGARSAAKFQTGSNDQEGIFQYLEKLGLGK